MAAQEQAAGGRPPPRSAASSWSLRGGSDSLCSPRPTPPLRSALRTRCDRMQRFHRVHPVFAVRDAKSHRPVTPRASAISGRARRRLRPPPRSRRSAARPAGDPRRAAASPPPSAAARNTRTGRAARHRRWRRRAREADRIDRTVLSKGYSWLDTPCRRIIGALLRLLRNGLRRGRCREIRSTRAADFVASPVRFRYGPPSFSPPCFNGLVALPVAGNDELLALAVLSPPGMAVSFPARSTPSPTFVADGDRC